jgi:hypothetical protein
MANTETQFITKCVINPEDRTITPENGGIAGVAHDYAVDAAQFVFPLTFSEINLSGDTIKRFVRYRKSGSDKWYVDQLTSAVVQDDTAGTYSFTWTLSNDAALIADEGFVYCALCIQEFESAASTKVVREWNSQLCRLVITPSADHTNNYISPTLLTDNAVIAAINAEVDSVIDMDTVRVTLTNTQEYPFNDSIKTVALSKSRAKTTYAVIPEVVSSTGGGVGDIRITDRMTNGFKISYSGAATQVVLDCYIMGGH